MIDTILFDLDSTLLPMNQEKFIQQYFLRIGQAFQDLDAKKIITAIQVGTSAMLQNDGSVTNQEAFWNVFSQFITVDPPLEQRFEVFYQTKFQELKSLTQAYDACDSMIQLLKQKGYRLALCTNPVFPRIATLSRIQWAGLNANDFSFITTFENSHFCKPKIQYYEEVLQILGVDASQCLMVGNDVLEDLCVHTLGMKTYLVTDYLINDTNAPIQTDYMGTFSEWISFVQTLPPVI